VINCRFGGLAEKICKTHPLVLAKRQNIGVRSTKALGLDLVARIWKVLGGFLEDSQNT
jgi:hypothetical protein